MRELEHSVDAARANQGPRQSEVTTMGMGILNSSGKISSELSSRLVDVCTPKRDSLENSNAPVKKDITSVPGMDHSVRAGPRGHGQHLKILKKIEQIEEGGLVEELLGLRARANRANAEHFIWQHTAPHLMSKNTQTGSSEDDMVCQDPAVLKSGKIECADAAAHGAQLQSRLPLSLDFPLPRHMCGNPRTRGEEEEEQQQHLQTRRRLAEASEAEQVSIVVSNEGAGSSTSGCVQSMLPGRLRELQGHCRPGRSKRLSEAATSLCTCLKTHAHLRRSFPQLPSLDDEHIDLHLEWLSLAVPVCLFVSVFLSLPPHTLCETLLVLLLSRARSRPLSLTHW